MPWNGRVGPRPAIALLLHVVPHGQDDAGGLSESTRLFFIVHLAQVLAACDHQPSPESGELASMRRQVVDALTIILPVRISTSRCLCLHFFGKQFFIQLAPSDAQHGGHAKRCCKRVSRLVGHDLAALTHYRPVWRIDPHHARNPSAPPVSNTTCRRPGS